MLHTHITQGEHNDVLLITNKCVFPDNTLAIVLGSVGAVLALAVMVIAIVVYTKKQKK